jgi:hypothetical protein
VLASHSIFNWLLLVFVVIALLVHFHLFGYSLKIVAKTFLSRKTREKMKNQNKNAKKGVGKTFITSFNISDQLITSAGYSVNI